MAPTSTEAASGPQDVLGAPYVARTLDLAPDFEGPVTATLVHRPADGPSTGKAVLHVHGFAEASRLHPESWTIWRQAAEKDASGLAAGPEFWARVDSLGDRPYHRPIDMKGLRDGEA